MFEPCPIIVHGLYHKRPFTSYDHMIASARDVISNASIPDQRAILDAHPRIGAPTTVLSRLSNSEQNKAATSPATLARLAALNAQYEAKFGFKFVVFVNGRSRDEIIPVLEVRMQGSDGDERAAGLVAMVDIARSRLARLLAEHAHL